MSGDLFVLCPMISFCGVMIYVVWHEVRELRRIIENANKRPEEVNK